MYCFSGVVVVVSVGWGRRKLLSSFCVEVISSETIKARVMKLGSCIHLDE